MAKPVLAPRLSLFALVLAAAAAAPCAGRPAFFWTTQEGTFLSLENLDMEASRFEGSSGESAGKRVTTSAQYDFRHGNGWVLGFGHEYSDLAIADSVAPPQTNGHLHTLHLATQWKTALPTGELRIAAAPAISVSSNALKNLNALERDSLQLWGAAVYTLHRGNANLVLGAARDHRFGAARVYPLAGFEWCNDTFSLRAVFPDFSLGWEVAKGWTVALEIAPDGNEWQAFNSDLSQDNSFRREAWQGQLGLSYRFSNGLEMGVLAGKHWRQRWRYLRQDDSVAQIDSADRDFFGVRLGWRLP